MPNKTLKVLVGCALVAVQWMVPSSAFAVGRGVPFGFREGFVPGAMAHPVLATGVDFSYYACLHFTDADSITETGYLWVSSFQDLVGVEDSQLNDFPANGYHMYAKYHFQADECLNQETCNALTRRNYAVNQAALELFLDPAQDTVLGIQNCGVAVANDADDVSLGFANVIEVGQKSETNEIANGDFEIKFVNWAFSAPGQLLFRDGNNPLAAPTLVFNANVTILGGPLNVDHKPEGSGNLYWVD